MEKKIVEGKRLPRMTTNNFSIHLHDCHNCILGEIRSMWYFPMCFCSAQFHRLNSHRMIINSIPPNTLNILDRWPQAKEREIYSQKRVQALGGKDQWTKIPKNNLHAEIHKVNSPETKYNERKMPLKNADTEIARLCFPFFLVAIRWFVLFSLSTYFFAPQNILSNKPQKCQLSQFNRINGPLLFFVGSRRRYETLVWLPCISASAFRGLVFLRFWWVKPWRFPSLDSGHVRFLTRKRVEEKHPVWLMRYSFSKGFFLKKPPTRNDFSRCPRIWTEKKRHPPEMKNKIPQQKLELDIFLAVHKLNHGNLRYPPQCQPPQEIRPY